MAQSKQILFVTITVILIFMGVSTLVAHGEAMSNCIDPVQNVLRFGLGNEKELANRICCQNHRFAEPSGFFVNKGLSSLLDSNNRTVFFDVTCNKPLFIAPMGRSFADWMEESNSHGWPSFREAELIKENIVEEPDGEVLSVCGTHLGHNLPDEKGPRYCINLVCIAGTGHGVIME